MRFRALILVFITLTSACAKPSEIYVLISVSESKDNVKNVNEIVEKHGLNQVGRITTGPIDDYLFTSERVSRFRVTFMPKQIAFDSSMSEYSAKLLNELCIHLGDSKAVVNKIEGDFAEFDISNCLKLKSNNK